MKYHEHYRAQVCGQAVIWSELLSIVERYIWWCVGVISQRAYGEDTCQNDTIDTQAEIRLRDSTGDHRNYFLLVVIIIVPDERL